MATKRQLKKRISYVCGELAADVLIAAHLSNDINREAVRDIVRDIAVLQEDARAKVSFAFDKAPRDFDNAAAYRKARRAYFKAAFARLRDQFGESVLAIVKKMNAVVPAETRKLLSQK